MSRFRVFLQGLKPGEIGFCIASVGAISALLLASNKVANGAEKRRAGALAELRRSQRHVDRLVSEGAPYEGLGTIKYYHAQLRGEARRVGVEDPTADELCDEWVRRRRRGDMEALKVELTRLKLKRFWHSIEQATQQHQKHQRQYGGGGDAAECNAAEPVLKDLLGGGMGKDQANDRLVLKTLMFLERLDLACCRNHPKCVWDRDAPSFYGFLRRSADVPADWPGPFSNEEDFGEDAPPMDSPEFARLYNAVPRSRLALRMHELEQ